MKIKILPQAQAHLAPLGQAQDKKAQALLDEAIETLTRVDGDRVLDEFEAVALRDAFDTVLPTGGPIDEAAATQIKSLVETRVAALRAEQVQSTEAIFTSEGAALTRFRGKIMGQINDTIKKANGRAVDVNMMLFAFTDKELADDIVALAEAHPNVTFRLLTDWSQLATSGSRQPPRLAKIAREKGLTNLQIKFKKDDPYIWSSTQNRPVFSHGHTKGLNHHKGFVTLIDGRPEKMAFGSFNWSKSAMKSNYENLMLLDRKDPDNRPIMKGYEKEFEAFWNNDNAALMYGEARREKDRLYKELYEAHGQTYTPLGSTPQGDDFADVPYAPATVNGAFDINSFKDDDVAQIQALVGKTKTNKILKELRDFGRFDSWTELLARVPDLASSSTWDLEQLKENLDFGAGGLSINTATATELDRAGFSKAQSQRIVARRDTHGAYESLDELDDISGIGQGTLDRIRETFHAESVVATYSAREPGAAAASTGWSADHQGTILVPKSDNTETEPVEADGNYIPEHRDDMEAMSRTMAAPVTDMLRRARSGDTFRLSMYGLSTNSDEWKEIERAVGRGVKLRVVIYKSYNAGAINKLQELKDQGFDVDFRIIKSKVMHEKFGVVGDDVFNGSANMSSSSIEKHTEDRFLFRNQPDLAHRFIEEFARLWEKGAPHS